MSKIKSAMIYMGLGALAATAVIKMMNCEDCSFDEFIKKEKRMLKQLKSKFM